MRINQSSLELRKKTLIELDTGKNPLPKVAAMPLWSDQFPWDLVRPFQKPAGYNRKPLAMKMNLKR